jgi:hypothetical protein
VRELTVYFGSERNLIGTLTFRDEAAGEGDLGVVLTNAGVIARTGLHGINVALARALARIGLPSIRFDKSGLGDSGRPSRALPAEQQSILETRLAMDEAQARHGVRRFAMIGFCSGADDAYWAALQDERICGLLLWDPYIYPTLKSKIVHFGNVVREHGVVDAVRRTLRAGARTLRARLKRRKMLAPGEEAPVPPVRFGRSYIPPAAEYAAGLQRLVDRGVEIKIVYSGSFSESYNYAGQYRDSFRGCGIADRISCLYLRQADHSLTSRAAQQALLQMALEWLGSLRARR